MTTLREAAQQALERLRKYHHGNGFVEDADCIAALEAALAQQAEPVQEPVAWNWMLDGLPYGRACYGDPPDADIAERAATAGRTVRLLYAAPPQRKPLPKHDQHCVNVPGYGLTAVRLVRAVERAHGIKE